MRRSLELLAVVAVSAFAVACERGDRSLPKESAPTQSKTGARHAAGAPAMQPNSAPVPPPLRGSVALEGVATFDGAMPTGVAVSNEGRIFVSFPRWSDPLETSVGELKGGVAVPFPDVKWNPAVPGEPATTFIGVQSVVIDPKNRLWALDTGTVNMGRVQPGGAKLVGIDLATNKPFVTIPFGPDAALPTSYLDDVRFDANRGKEGFAYISDSSATGPNAIVVVDLDSKKAWRRLVDHPSVKAAPGFLAIVEGAPLYKQLPMQPRTPFAVGVDGIEVSPDGKKVFYSPLGSRHLYSVSADALSDPNTPDSQVAATVVDLGDKGASDGFIMASDGQLYVTEYENDAILRRNLDGTFEPVVADPRLIWPDSMSIGPDGYVYVIANQLDRQAAFQGGSNLRQKPYLLLRMKTGAAPIRKAR